MSMTRMLRTRFFLIVYFISPDPLPSSNFSFKCQGKDSSPTTKDQSFPSTTFRSVRFMDRFPLAVCSPVGVGSSVLACIKLRMAPSTFRRPRGDFATLNHLLAPVSYFTVTHSFQSIPRSHRCDWIQPNRQHLHLRRFTRLVSRSL